MTIDPKLLRTPPPEGMTNMASTWVDPVSMIHKAANEDDQPLVIKATLRLLDENGLPSTYLSGPSLNSALQNVYSSLIRPLNEERLTMLAGIGDFKISPRLIEQLTTIYVDPVIQRLQAPEARLLKLAMLSIKDTHIDIPSGYWWTPPLIDRLKEANPDRNQGGWAVIVATANHLIYYYLSTHIPWDILPLNPSNDHHLERLAWVRRDMINLIRGSLTGLLSTHAAQTGPIPAIRP